MTSTTAAHELKRRSGWGRATVFVGAGQSIAVDLDVH
jgi:hypothetical protein